jgi:hypothetical protein
VFSPSARWATGLRNTGGLSFDSAGRIFGVQHGRDQLAQNWPKLYTIEQGVERPAEILYSPFKGADFGWPTCYYDGFQNRHVLAPEYGGDGGKAQGICEGKTPPVAAFPAHLAPNDVAVYTGHSFPAAYAQGAFIAFHGSWNRAPAPQDGYFVVFQPLKDGKPNGPWIRFADGFAGPNKEPGRAIHRPAGLALGPDGALYVADDRRGTIWRITYSGPADAPITAAPAAQFGTVTQTATTTTLPPASPPHRSRRAAPSIWARPRAAPVRAVTDRMARAARRADRWSAPHGCGATVRPRAGPHHHHRRRPSQKTSGAMPALGGAALDGADVKAVAAYVWTLRQGAS